MKLAFSTLGCSELQISEIAALAAANGIGYLELRGVGGVLDPSALDGEEIADALSSHGINPIVFGSSASFHTPELAARAEAELYAAADLCARIGCPYIRVFGNRLPRSGRNEALADIAGRLHSAANLVASRGVTLLLEVHGDLNTVETLLPVISSLQDESLGLIWDICHTDAPYGDAWVDFYRELSPHILHVHIKDRRRSSGGLCAPGEGDIPISDIVARMLGDGYDGVFSFEWERLWHPELAPLPEVLPSFLRLFK